MSTIVQTPRRRRFLAATMLVAAGAAASSMLAPAAPANAATNYVALSYSPVDDDFGFAKDGNRDRAVTRSLSNCGYVASHCVYIALSKNGCVALATRGVNPNGGPAAYGGGSGSNRTQAQQAALRASGGGIIDFTYCL